MKRTLTSGITGQGGFYLVVYFINSVTYTHRQMRFLAFHPKRGVLQLSSLGRSLVDVVQ